MIDGVELFQLRQRRTANGDTYFTGKLGNAAVIVVRDDFERDLWKVVAGDPFQTRHDRPSPARADARTALEDRSSRLNDLDDDLPEDLLTGERISDDED